MEVPRLNRTAIVGGLHRKTSRTPEVGRPWRASSLPGIGGRRKFRTSVPTVAYATILVPKDRRVMAIRSALAGLVVVKVQHSAGGIPWEWTCHARTADASVNTSAKMNDLADKARIAWHNATAAALLNDANTFVGVTVQDLSPALLPDEFQSQGETGTRGTALVPQSSCCVVTKRTALVGRAFRGRAYISGAVAADLDATGTEWDSGYATACENAVDDVLDAFATASPIGYTPVIYHRHAGQGGVPAADTVTTITAVLGRTELAQQKSRRS